MSAFKGRGSLYWTAEILRPFWRAFVFFLGLAERPTFPKSNLLPTMEDR
jgi:hypothetical protein